MLPLRCAIALTSLLALGACAGDPETDMGLKVGSAELDAGATSAALQTAEALASAHPDDPRRLILLGRADMAAGRLSLADAVFRHALHVEPGSFDAKFGLARLHTVTDPAAAFAEFSDLARRRPQAAAVLTDLGVAADLRGHASDAQGFYRQALAINPSLVSAQVDLGLSLAISGHAGEATRILGPIATSTDGSTRVRADYAVAAALNGDGTTAATVLGQDMAPDDARSAILAYKAFDRGVTE